MLLYAWVPGFYAEVERRENPVLRDRPILVGGDPRKRGLVQAATEDARAAGVVPGMAVVDALTRCPRARALRTNMRRYREAGNRLHACLRREAGRIESAGMDAAWLDARESRDGATALAERLRRRVRDDLGLPLRVGIAPVKFLAKLAAEEAGPEGVLRIDAGAIRGFLDPLPLERLPGVGPRTAERLAELSVRTAGDLARMDARILEEALGNHGRAIQAYAQGRDADTIRAAAGRRSLTQAVTLPEGELDRAALEMRLAELASGLEAGLALERLAARRLALRVRYADQGESTRSRTCLQPVAASREIASLAVQLLERTQAGSRPIRGLALTLGSLVRSRREDGQLELFPQRR
jgi:DNA polymerase-4